LSTVEPSAALVADLERIRARLAALIEEHFEAGNGRYYLSQLGVQLGADRKRLEELTGQKLATYLQATFEFQMGRTGASQNVLYLVNPTGPADVPETRTGPLPRYAPQFWKAFSVPIATGERRFIDLDSFAFGPDEAPLRVSGSDVREIGSEYLALDNSRTARDVATKIEEWLESQKLDSSRFLRHPKIVSRKTVHLLDQLIGALDDGQLARVVLPLDVVRTLMKS
jgi:hypothetical protein